MPSLVSLVLAALLAAVAAAPAAAAPPPSPAAPATSPAGDAVPSYVANDLDALRPHVGQMIEITGSPTATGKSKSGSVMYLNFAGAHQAVALIFFLSGGAGAGADTGARKPQSEDDLKVFVGKPVRVKGKLADYKGDLQIVIDSLDQIKVNTP